MSQTPLNYPFSAIVGQEDAKLALILNCIDPSLGGVLLRGEKGAAKTTLARGLSQLLSSESHFCELPLGATEDRLVGGFDLKKLLENGEQVFKPGILSDAHNGVLYVDEVNLLADHLVDVLLDVAQSGVNRIEREGISHVHRSRFVLVGSMNPEEGELRPQLLDRFGLGVTIKASIDSTVRGEIIRRRMDFEADPLYFVERFKQQEKELADRLAQLSPMVASSSKQPDENLKFSDSEQFIKGLNPTLASVKLEDEIVELASRLCIEMGVEGLRSDLIICKSARALCLWEGRCKVTVGDIRRVAPLALAHRLRLSPLDFTDFDSERLTKVLESLESKDQLNRSGEIRQSLQGKPHKTAKSETPVERRDAAKQNAPDEINGSNLSEPDQYPGQANPEQNQDGGQANPELRQSRSETRQGQTSRFMTVERLMALSGPSVQSSPNRAASPQGPSRLAGHSIPHSSTNNSRGRVVASRSVDDNPSSIAILDSLYALSVRRATMASNIDSNYELRFEDLREKVRETTTRKAIILVVDSSNSMGAKQRIESVKKLISSWLLNAYAKRISIGLVTFGDEEARIILEPTSSIEVANVKLNDIQVKGTTPLAKGMEVGNDLAQRSIKRGLDPICFLITDGRATSKKRDPDPFQEAILIANKLSKMSVPWIVVRHELDSDTLNLSNQIAQALQAPAIEFNELILSSSQEESA